jgi:hypothetical protein
VLIFLKKIEIVWAHLELKCKSYEKNKKTKKRKKRSEPTRPISAQPAHLARRLVQRILCAARPADTPTRPTNPGFSFIFSIFQNLSPLKNKYLKIYNTFFGSVCFYTFLTRNPTSPTNLRFYPPQSRNPPSRNIDSNLWASKLRYLPSTSTRKL